MFRVVITSTPHTTNMNDHELVIRFRVGNDPETYYMVDLDELVCLCGFFQEQRFQDSWGWCLHAFDNVFPLYACARTWRELGFDEEMDEIVVICIDDGDVHRDLLALELKSWYFTQSDHLRDVPMKYALRTSAAILLSDRQNYWSLCDVDRGLHRHMRVMAKAARLNPEDFVHMAEAAQNDPDVVLNAVRKLPSNFQYASQEMRKSITIALEAVKYTGGRCQESQVRKVVEHTSPAVRNNIEFAMAVVQDNPILFEMLGDVPRNTTCVAEAAIQYCGYRDRVPSMVLQHGGSNVTQDRSIVISAAKRCDTALLHAHTDFRGDREILMAAVECGHPSALRFASPEMKDDLDFVRAAMEKSSGRTFKYAGSVARDTPDLAMSAVKYDWRLLDHVGQRSQNNPDIVRLAMAQDANAFKCAGQVARDTPEIAIEAMQSPNGSWELLQEAGPTCLNNEEVMNEAFRRGHAGWSTFYHGWHALQYAEPDIRNNEAIIMAAITSSNCGWRALRFAGPDIVNNYSIVTMAVERCGSAIKLAGPVARENPDIIDIVLRQSGGSYMKYAGPGLKQNRDFVRTSTEKYGGCALQHACDKFRCDRELLLLAGEVDGVWPWNEVFKTPGVDYSADREMVEGYLRRDGHKLQHAARDLRFYDVSLVKIAVTQAPRALRYARAEPRAPEECRRLPEVYGLAIAKDGLALEYAGSDARRNRDVVLSAVRLDGRALKFAARHLRADAEVRAVAVATTPSVETKRCYTHH